MKFIPIGERILVQPIREQDKKVGSIIIPKTTEERPDIGIVLALGDDIVIEGTKRKLLSEIVKAGDIIIYRKYAGTVIEDGTNEYIMIERGDMLAIKESIGEVE